MDRHAAGAVAALVLVGLAGGSAAGAETLEELEARVRAREIAFARTMADRDHAAFATFVSEEALFYSPTLLRGRAAVAAGWKRFFEGEEAPFSWAPDRVAVVDSGSLAISTGPVLGPAGARVGTFVSTWRLEGDGVWRIVLDIGCPACECPEGECP